MVDGTVRTVRVRGLRLETYRARRRRLHKAEIAAQSVNSTRLVSTRLTKVVGSSAKDSERNASDARVSKQDAMKPVDAKSMRKQHAAARREHVRKEAAANDRARAKKEVAEEKKAALKRSAKRSGGVTAKAEA